MLPFQSMDLVRRNHPHLRLTAAILVAMLAALAGGLAADASESRARRLELHSALRLVAADDVEQTSSAPHARCLASATDSHAEVAALVASDRSAHRAERALRRTAAHSRAALLRTTALPPPQA